MVRPRIFVSSVMEQFGQVREAARQSILAAGCDPVLIEDFPSQNTSPRNACLDAVESCDGLVLIVGSRAGWTAPSGKPVVLEEFDHARLLPIPTYLFILEEGRIDDNAAKLIEVVSSYVDGAFRVACSTLADLSTSITASLQMGGHSMKEGHELDNALNQLLSEPARVRNDPVLRITMIPERSGMVFDPLEYDTDEFREAVYMAGYQVDPRFFLHENSKKFDAGVVGFNVRQFTDDPHSHKDLDLVVKDNGIVSCDMNIAIAGNAGGPFAGGYVLESDVHRCLISFLTYWAELTKAMDPYRRYRMWKMNLALINLEFRPLLQTVPEGSSMQMRMTGEEMVIAYESSRNIDISDANALCAEADRATVMLRRKSNGRNQ